LAANIHHQDTKAQRTIKTMLFFVSLCLGGFPAFSSETLTVAVASSFYPQAMQYSKQFEAKHHVQVRLVAGSTGRLFNQIQQGAPFDIFIAADEAYAALFSGEKTTIAQGYLGLSVRGKWVTDLQVLQDASIKSIAIANPNVAPFGKAAKKILKQAALWDSIQAKLVYAQNAMQATMMVDQGLVDAGLIATDEKAVAFITIPYVALGLNHKAITRQFLQSYKLPDMVLP